MRTPILIGLIGGIIVAGLQYFSITQNSTSTLGAILYYSPMLVYFASVYISIKRMRDESPDGILDFKTGLQAGGITSVIISLIWGIGFFIALTNVDVRALVKYLEANGQHDQVRIILPQITRQQMFERAKFFSIPNFLLGFFVTLAVTMIFRRKAARNVS